MKYDSIILGGGPGGYVAAIRMAQYGLQVALVEADAIGGTCLNRGCIPTKTLLHTSEVLTEAGHTAGVLSKEMALDWPALRARKVEVSDTLRGGIESLLKANGVTVLRGQGFVTGAQSVRVTLSDGSVQDLEGENLVIGQRSGQIPRHPLPKGPDLPVRRDQQLPRQAQRRPLCRGGPRPDTHRGKVGIPAKGQPAVRRHAGEPAGGLRRPLDQLAAGQAVGVEGGDLAAAVGQAVQRAVGQRHAAPGADVLDKDRQAHGKAFLLFPQPGRQVLVQQRHAVVGRDGVYVGA